LVGLRTIGGQGKLSYTFTSKWLINKLKFNLSFLKQKFRCIALATEHKVLRLINMAKF